MRYIMQYKEMRIRVIKNVIFYSQRYKRCDFFPEICQFCDMKIWMCNVNSKHSTYQLLRTQTKIR